MIIRPYDDTLLIVHCLIPHTTDGIAVVLAVVVAVHGGFGIVEVAVVHVAATDLGSTPEVGAVAVIAVVAASGNGRKSCGIVAALCVANRTCCGTCTPV